MKTKKTIWGRLALFTATFFWGTSFVVLKNALDQVDILWILAVRFSIAALLFALFANRKLLHMTRENVLGSILIGACLAAAYIVQTYGLKYTTPGKNAFLTAVYCVLVPFLAWAIYRKKPAAYNIVAAFLCMIGIGFVSLGGETAGLNRGDILTLLCGIFYALLIIMMERYVSNCEAVCISAIEFAAAAVICWIGTLLFEHRAQQVTPALWGSILYMAVVCTGLCFFLQAWGIRYTPSSTAAVILTFEAVFGAFSSVIFYHEALTLKLVVGFLLIFLSVVISETGTSFLKGRKRT